MIDNEQYKEAVELYHKTISVLTKHSHLLSFKNIKVSDIFTLPNYVIINR